MSVFSKNGKGRMDSRKVAPEQTTSETKAVTEEVVTSAVAADVAQEPQNTAQGVEDGPTTNTPDVAQDVPQPPVEFVEPVATEQPTPEVTSPPKQIKVGSVVGKNEASLGKEASQEHKKAISTESTSKAVDTSTAFQQRIAKIFVSDNKRERYVATFMEEYLKAMSPGIGVTVEDGVRMQATLWRTMKNVVENDDGFKEAFRLMIAYFKEYRNGAFHESYIHRFHPDLTMNPGDITGLVRMANLLTIASGVKNKADVRKFVNISATFDSGLSDAARNRVISYFDN